MQLEKQFFQHVVELIYQAIDTEVGEQREYSAETEAVVAEIQRILKEALELPENHYL